MTEYETSHNGIDGYIAELTEEEREKLATAETAIELAFLLHRARQVRGLTQTKAAELAGLRQQAVSRFEQPDIKLANTKIDTLRKYLCALDYVLHVGISDAASGAMVSKIRLEPGSIIGDATPKHHDAQVSRHVATTQDGAGHLIAGNDDLARATQQSAVA